MMDKYAEI